MAAGFSREYCSLPGRSGGSWGIFGSSPVVQDKGSELLCSSCSKLEAPILRTTSNRRPRASNLPWPPCVDWLIFACGVASAHGA